MGRARGAIAVAGLAWGLLWTAGAWAADAPRVFREAAAEGGELRYIHQVPVLLLQGTPEQMGRQQAALVFDVARRNAHLPKAVLGEYGGRLLWPIVARVGRGLMADAPERHRRELDAAFAKAGFNEEDKDAVLVANGLIELRSFSLCSAFLVEPKRSATGEMLFGRNFDVPSFGGLDRLVLVAVYRPAGQRAFAAVTWPGFIGVLSGMNDAGLAVACLDSGPAKDDSPALAVGAPMSLTFRRILEECKTIDEAEKLLRDVKRTTWMNLAACDRQRAVVFELTPKTVAVRGAEDHLLASTNHFRTPELGLGADCRRYRILRRYWARTQPFTLPNVAYVMNSVHLGRDTTQSMIFEPAVLRLHLAIGKPPASSGPFVPLDLKELFERKVAAEAK